MRRSVLIGVLLVTSGALSIGGYLVLGTQFGWPAVLDEPGATALDAFVEAQAWVRFGFYLFLLSSLALIPAAIGLHDELGADSTAARSVAAFGVLGAFAQMLGWVRWPITVPGLAAVLALRAARVPRWFAILGLVVAAGWALAVPTATAVGLEALEFWGLNVYTAWYLWLMALGLLLLRRRTPGVREPAAAQALPALP